MRWISIQRKRTPKRPHLRVNLVLHKCFRSSHRQGCSPHSPLREIRNKFDFPTLGFRLNRSTTNGDQEAGALPTICLVRRYAVRRRTLCKSEVPGHLETKHIPTELQQRSIPYHFPSRARSSDGPSAQQSLRASSQDLPQRHQASPKASDFNLKGRKRSSQLPPICTHARCRSCLHSPFRR